MGLKILTVPSVLCLYFIVTADALDLQLGRLTTMEPPYHHQAMQTGNGFKKPTESKVGVRNPSQSHFLELPSPPRKILSRVVVAKTQSTDTMKMFNTGDQVKINIKDKDIKVAAEEVNIPLEKLMDIKDKTTQKVENVLIKTPLVMVETMKSIPVSIMNLPLEKSTSLLDKVSLSPMKIPELEKNITLEKQMPAVFKTEEVKNVVSSTVGKIGNLKDDLVEKAVVPAKVASGLKEPTIDIPQKLDAIPMDQNEKPEIFPEIVGDKTLVNTDKLDDLKNAEISLSKLDTVMQLPISKTTDFMKIVEPIEKLDHKLISSPPEKVSVLKEADFAFNPLEKSADVKDVIAVSLPIDKVDDTKEATLEKVASPIEKATNVKDVVSGIAIEPFNKLDEIKDTSMSKLLTPLENMEDLKEGSLMQLPMEMDKTNDVLKKFPLDLKQERVGGVGLVLSPVDKFVDAKDAVLEKVQIPLEKAGEIKDDTNNKSIDVGKKGDMVNSTLTKMSDILEPVQDLKDVVHNAFQKTLSGGYQNIFKQAITAMNKGELDALREALVTVFSVPGLALSITGNIKPGLQKELPELPILEGNNTTKEALVGAESILKPKQDEAVLNRKDESLKIVPMGSSKTKGMERRMPYYRHYQTSGSGWGWRRSKRSIYGIGTPAHELQRFPPPARLRVPMKTAFRQVNSAAPADPYPRSKESLSLPLLSINEAGTDKIMMDIKEGLQYVLQTRNEWTFAIHGTGTTGCHAVLDNLIEDGDKVLALINGYWGELMANMSERLGAQVIRYNKSPGTVFNLDEIKTAMLAHKPDLVLVVQGESSTTVRQPLDGIGNLCAKNGALLIADVVGVAGMQPVLMDKYQMDAVFTSSHKGLGGVVGLAPISLSPMAVQKIRNRLTPPRAYQTDLVLQYQLWNTRDPDRIRFQSSSLPLLYALRDALATLVEEKLENTFKRHELATEHLNRGLAALGLEHFVENPADRQVGITAVKPPTGKDPTKIANYMFKHYNIEISSGFGPTQGKVLRFATFASNADTLRVSKLLRALKNALNSRETSVSF